MFAKFLSNIAKIRKVLVVVLSFFDMIHGVLEAARANGYKAPGEFAAA